MHGEHPLSCYRRVRLVEGNPAAPCGCHGSPARGSWRLSCEPPRSFYVKSFVHAVAREAVVKVAGAVAADGAPPPRDLLAERASQIGEAWVEECLRDLHAHARAPVGAWPGTMSEARRRVVTQLPIVLAPERLQELARVANLAARRGWQKVCEPDLEL